MDKKVSIFKQNALVVFGFLVSIFIMLEWVSGSLLIRRYRVQAKPSK